MSLSLHSLTLDQQASTPTPGSPHHYIPVEHHDRLNSIQLSSDASGEYSVTHSPRSLMGGPPGEGLSELRNARNPPWLHGLTGTPPSILGLHRADRAGRWVEDARRFPEQTVDFRAHANLARLSLGHGLIPNDSSRAMSSLPHSPVMAINQDSFSRPSRDGGSNKGLRHRPSPFDKPFHGGKAGDTRDHRHEYDSLTNPPSAMFSQSGDASSEEGEAWPMPETPFISHDVWSGNANHKQFSKPADKLASPHHNPSALSPEHHKGAHSHRKPVNGGGRANVMLNGKPAVKEGERRIGRCKMYNCDKGVGFLIDDRLDQVPHDVKIHWTDIFSDQEFKSLAKGEIVEYTLNITANGFSASYVTGPGGRSVMGAEQAIVQASRQTSYKLFKAGALPVKTYRSKWESLLSPGAGDGSPAQASAASANDTKLEPASMANSSALSQSIHAVKSNNSPPTGKTQEVVGEAAGLEKKDAISLGRDRYSNSHGRVMGGLNSANQFNTPAWDSLRSPMGYIQSPNLATGFAGSTPLPALSPSVMTPHSADSFNSVFTGGYTPHNMASLRTPGVNLASPSDVLMTNRLLSGSQPGVNQADIQSFLEQRQILLQQQALLMSMYQNTTQSTPASSIQAFNRNPTSSKQTQPFYGAFEKAHHTLDPKLQYLGLLPPIALPAIKEAPKLADLMKKRANGPWRAPNLLEVNVETPAGLRASAETFTPAGSTSPNTLTAEGQLKPSAVLEPDALRKTGSPVYQIPGRRSVSDPAAPGVPGGKKTSGHVQKNNQNLNMAAPHVSQYKPVGDKALGQKRVTFAEHVVPARRVVSHGEVPGTPIGREAVLEESFSEAGEESYDISADSSFANAHSVEKALLEDVRKAGNVTSVDLAMERLREAAGTAASLTLKKPSADKGDDPAGLAKALESCEPAERRPELSLIIQEAVVPMSHQALQA